MKLTIPALALKEALTLLAKYVSTKPTLPILANVMLDARIGEQLILQTTNLENALELSISAHVAEPGQVTVNCKDFLKAVSGYVRGDLELERLPGCRLGINHEEVTILGIDPEEFPPMYLQSDFLQMSKYWSRDLVEAIGRVGVACPPKPDREARPVLAGILIKLDQNGYVMTAADGFRIHSWSVGEIGDAYQRMIVPIENMQRMAAMLAKQMTDVSAKILHHEPTAENKTGAFAIEFSWHHQTKHLEAQARMVSQLIEGNYPPYEQVLPIGKKDDLVTTINVDTQALIEALQGIRPVAVKTLIQSVHFVIRPDRIFLSAQSDEGDRARRSVPCEATHVGELYVVLNNQYAIEALQGSLTTRTEIEIYLHDSGFHTRDGRRYSDMPWMFYSVPRDNYFACVMPQQVNEYFPRDLTSLPAGIKVPAALQPYVPETPSLGDPA